MTQANSFDTAAHRLLDDLDARHDQLLLDLDALNARVDQVLSQTTQLRPDTAPTAIELAVEADDSNGESDSQ